MATLITETTWHGNPRGTVTYAGTVYVSSVTSPYIHIPSGGSAATVPTYVSRQGPTPTVVTAAAPVTGGLPETTSFLNSIIVTPTGVWEKGTTLTMTAESIDGTETETLVITIPRNTTQDDIPSLLALLIENSTSGFKAFTSAALLLVNNTTFTGGPQCTFTAVTITAP